MKQGFILIDKPSGITSHDVVDKLRKITGIKKIGHAGTLDPFAKGLLILGIGREFTKKLFIFQKEAKEYIAILKLGFESNTFDIDGKIVEKKIKKIPEEKEVKRILKNFLGEILQTPPIFSAKKIKGEKLYNLARRGVRVRPKKIKVKIFKISVLKYKFPYLKIRVNCSGGTYIRSLANDIGKKLKCGAIVQELTRTKIGKFSLKEATKLLRLTTQNWEKFLIS